MTVIFVAEDKEDEAIEQINPIGSYECYRTNHTGVVHYARHVVVVGHHPQIAARYKGIAKVETLTLHEE